MSLVPKPSGCLVTAPLTRGILASRNSSHLRAPVLRLRLATAFGRLPVLAHPRRGRKRRRQLREAFIGWKKNLAVNWNFTLVQTSLGVLFWGQENRAPCVPALPRWCWGLGAGVATGTGGPAGLAPPGALAAPGAVGPVSVVVAGSGGSGPGVALPPA